MSCGVPKQVTAEFFHRHAQSPDGFKSACKPCRSLEAKRTYDPAKQKVQGERYRTANRDKVLEAARLYRETNLEKTRAAKKRWRDENPEKDKAAKTAWNRANLGYQKVWRSDNPEKVLDIYRSYRARNPEKVTARGHNARARKRNAEGTHTGDDVERQFQAQGGRCWWCGVKLKRSGVGKFEVDHVVALAVDGSNWPENIVCSCRRCNRQKRDRSPLEFAGRLF